VSGSNVSDTCRSAATYPERHLLILVSAYYRPIAGIRTIEISAG
jgi:hypothetical protein